jgi:hypothetical protein
MKHLFKFILLLAFLFFSITTGFSVTPKCTTVRKSSNNNLLIHALSSSQSLKQTSSTIDLRESTNKKHIALGDSLKISGYLVVWYLGNIYYNIFI